MIGLHLSRRAACQRAAAWSFLLVVLSLVGAPAASAQSCPSSWDDAGVPIPDPAPPAPDGTAPSDILQLHSFIQAEGIDSIEAYLADLPPHLRQSYAFVDSSRAGRPADTQRPRIILFGSDARFLAALGSHPDDPERETIDLAQLNDATGFWDFASIDFSAEPPRLITDSSNCQSCHGTPPRPIWGSYNDWPGTFGETRDRLSAEQATSVRAFHDLAEGQPVDPIYPADRFTYLEYDATMADAQDDSIFSLPERVYPYANTVFNHELSMAIGEGVYRRMANHPRWPLLREAYLFTSACRDHLPDFYDSDGYAAAIELISAVGGTPTPSPPNAVYDLLEISPDNDFSIHRLAFETPDVAWAGSGAFIYGLVEFLTLLDLSAVDPQIAQILDETPDLQTPFSDGCFPNLAELARYRLYQGWTLRTEARREARATQIDLNINRGRQGMLQPISQDLCPLLEQTLQTRMQDGLGAVPDGSRLPGRPLRVDKQPDGRLLFEWDVSCGNSADYALYRGTLGNFTSHAPRNCSTAGQPSTVDVMPPGDAYFLVVPVNAMFEGSYGIDGQGGRRPAGATTCREAQLIACE